MVNSGLGDISVGGEDVTLNGKVYAEAIADLQTSSVDFGVVRKGDAVAARSVAIGNTATGDLTDELTGGFSAVDSPFTASGDLDFGVAAGATDTTSLSVGLDTSTAGVFSGDASLELFSHNGDMSDLSLAGLGVSLATQVNELANPLFEKVTGEASLSGGDTLFTLDFGSIAARSPSIPSAPTPGWPISIWLMSVCW